jgi:hypothetical protein
MTFTILARRSSVPAKVPTTTQLILGEVSINTYDGLLFFVKSQAGANSVVALGPVPPTANALSTARNIGLSGDASGSASFDGSASVSIATTLAASGVSAGIWNTVTVNAKGLITTGANTAYALLASPAFSGTPSAPTAALATNTTQLATTAFVQSALGSAGRSVTTYSGTGSQTAFTIPAAVTANDLIVSVGGVLLNPAVDYTVAGTTLTFAVAPDVNSVIWILLLGVTVGGGYLVANVDATITGSWTFTKPIIGTAAMSYNADMAERYASDAPYDVATVVVFGGDHEITACIEEADHRVAGVISGHPAYTMNHAAGGDATHPCVALVGRVPCKVVGVVKKGDWLITSATKGHARASGPTNAVAHRIIGKSLENKYDAGAGIVQVALVR